MNTVNSKWISLKDTLNYDYSLQIDGFYNQIFEKYAMEDFHKHTRIEIMYVEDGECSILFLDDDGNISSIEEVKLSSGTGIIIDANVWHKLIVKDKCKMINHEYLLELKEETNSIKDLVKNSKEITSFISKFQRYAIFYENNKIKWFLNTIIEEAKESKEYQDYLNTMTMYANLLLVEIARSYNIYNKISSYEVYVKKAIKYINNHLKEKIKSEDIASYANINYAYLEGKFKNRIGMTLGDYIAKQKCYLAETLLKNSSLSIATISTQLGFGTRQQFNNVFKKHIGYSPNTYRMKHQLSAEEIRYGFTGAYGIEFIYDKKTK